MPSTCPPLQIPIKLVWTGTWKSVFKKKKLKQTNNRKSTLDDYNYLFLIQNTCDK